uniref:Uncharacterized protein n=1 Tax=Triticum urartu TaxID=4572 RepID=A0A8R7PPM9_TRIUA
MHVDAETRLLLHEPLSHLHEPAAAAALLLLLATLLPGQRCSPLHDVVETEPIGRFLFLRGGCRRCLLGCIRLRCVSGSRCVGFLLLGAAGAVLFQVPLGFLEVLPHRLVLQLAVLGGGVQHLGGGAGYLFLVDALDALLLVGRLGGLRDQLAAGHQVPGRVLLTLHWSLGAGSKIFCGLRVG